MSAPERSNSGVPPQASAETQPSRIAPGLGHPEYHFVQAVMELRTAMHQMDTDSKVAMARLEGKVDSLKESSDSTRKKVEDLVRWKTLILGGAVTIGVVVSVLVGLVTKFGDRFSMDAKQQISAPVAPSAKPTK